MFEEIYKDISAHSVIIIHRHKYPDGDAAGAQAGLKIILRDNFPDKEVYIVGDDPKRYSFIEGSRPDDVPDKAYKDALAIILDTSSSALISDERYKTAKHTCRIDHHIFCEKIADNELTDTSYESCCGLITQLAIECSLNVSPSAAAALYTGMATDSGRFRYDSTTANTFALAKFLMERGIDISGIYSSLYADDFENIKLRAKYILKIKFTKINVAYIYTSADELNELNAGRVPQYRAEW